MDIPNESTKRIHHGRNIMRIRTAKGMKQEAMAAEMNMSQQAISKWEKRKSIDADTLARFAKILGVSVDVLKDMEEDPANIIIENNTFENGSNLVNTIERMDNTIHPIDKLLKLAAEKEALYERLLAAEKEKVAYLEKLLKMKGL